MMPPTYTPDPDKWFWAALDRVFAPRPLSADELNIALNYMVFPERLRSTTLEVLHPEKRCRMPDAEKITGMAEPTNRDYFRVLGELLGEFDPDKAAKWVVSLNSYTSAGRYALTGSPADFAPTVRFNISDLMAIMAIGSELR